jgi:PPOX class probable F420-dependent enzyme
VTAEALWKIISASRNGVLATVGHDGLPQLSNVYYLVDASSGVVRFSTTTRRVKGRNLQRDPRAVLHVAGRDFLNFAVAEGRASLSIAQEAGDEAIGELYDVHCALGAARDRTGFDAQMIADNRMAVRVDVEKVYGQIIDR